MKSIALFEHHWCGHHPMYLKLITEAALSLELEVMIFCPAPQEMRDWLRENFVNAEHRTHCFAFHEPERSSVSVRYVLQALDSLKLWRCTARAIKRAHAETGYLPDLVFFPWLDSYVTHLQSRYLIDRLFPYNWSGLLFHPYHMRLPLSLEPLRHGPLDLDEALKSQRCRAIGVLDEGVQHKLEKKLCNKKVVIFPDVSDEAKPDVEFPVLEKIKKESRGRKIVSILGSLEKRKGILTLLDVALHHSLQHWFFVFAGKIATTSFLSHELERLLQLAADPPENCFFYLEFIPDEHKFNALVEISDVLFAAYEDFPHSSNILTKGAIFHRPVIVSRGHCMAERVAKYKTGMIVDYGAADQCRAAIQLLCGAPRTGTEAPEYDRYQTMHSRGRLLEALRSIIDCYRIHQDS